MSRMTRPPTSSGMTRPTSSSTSTGMTRPVPSVETEIRDAVVAKLAKLSERQWTPLVSKASAYATGKIQPAEAASLLRTLKGYFPLKYRTGLGTAFTQGNTSLNADIPAWFSAATARRVQKTVTKTPTTGQTTTTTTTTTSIPLDFQPSAESGNQITTTVPQSTGRTKVLLLGGALLTAGVAAWLMLRKR